ncbi:MAG: efflux RND transporter permease subunit [Myxococcota bacterium]|nr:efflux RND transporter permease subunit [Myxococcota bacterium]
MIEKILRLGVKNPVLVNMIFWVVCIAGLLSWHYLPKEQFPKIQVDQVFSWIYWEGSVEDLEDIIIRPMEEAIEDVDGVKNVYADAYQNRALVTVQFARGTDVEKARNDIEKNLGNQSFPDDIVGPETELIKVSLPVMNIALQGDLQAIEKAEKLSEELNRFPGVQSVAINGAQEQVIRIDINQEKAKALRVTTQTITQLIQSSNAAAPIGKIDRGEGKSKVRKPRSNHTLEDLSDIRIPHLSGSIPLKEIATVYTEWIDPAEPLFVNGQPSIVLTVYRSEDADAIKISHALKGWLEEKKGSFSPPLSIVGFDDTSVVVQDRLFILASNAGIGIVLVAAFLGLFIGYRNTALVIWGMPVAYLGAVVLMYASNTSVTVISTFALLLVTGIIVDDAVIIVENVQRHLELGKNRVQAAIDGTKEVFGAVMASTLTTCLAFAPLLMLEGAVGRVMATIPIVVIFSLLASLLEAFFVLPSHLGHYAKEQTAEESENLVSRKLKESFRPLLTYITRPKTRYGVIFLLFCALVASFTLGSFMRTSLNTQGHPYFVYLNIDLPEGTNQSKTTQVLRETEEFVYENSEGLSKWISARSGRQVHQNSFHSVGERYGQIKIGFHNQQSIFDQVPAFLDTVRTFIQHHPEISSFSIETLEGGPPAGRDLDIRLRSTQTADLFPAMEQFSEFLASREAVFDVQVKAVQGPWEYEVQFDRDKGALLGVSEAQVAALARGAIDGNEAITMPIDERKTSVYVRMRDQGYTPHERLSELIVGYTSRGDPVYLSQVATLERKQYIERLQRVNGQRALRISALVNPELSTAEEEQGQIEEFFAQLKAQYPSLSIFYGGRLESSAESFARLPAIFSLAVLMIYSVLAIQFRSYLQPFIILSAIPLGLAGVIISLFLLRMDLSFIAMIGSIGLVGIVVNDVLVLIDFINKRRQSGLETTEAVVEATLLRLRPILITTITTVLGLAPLGLGLAGKEPILAPMAVSIGFGLGFATILSIFAVPTLYLMMDDIRGLFGRSTTEKSNIYTKSTK